MTENANETGAENAELPRLGPEAEADVLSRIHAGREAEEVLADILHGFRDEAALVSSFGAESAVLLHMISRIDKTTPVLFLETGMLFEETLIYQQYLAALFGLENVQMIRPAPEDLEEQDPDGTLHQENTDGCCFLRKTLPLRRALEPYALWITGRKRHQAATRANLELFEAEKGTQRIKLNPLADWDAARIRAYMEEHNLPPHPLVGRGYPSIGCAPCTTPVKEGEDPRAGRWRGADKTECGIHYDGEKWVRTPAARGVVSTFP